MTPDERRAWLNGLGQGIRVLIVHRPRHANPNDAFADIREDAVILYRGKSLFSVGITGLTGRAYFRTDNGKRTPLYQWKREDWRIEPYE